MLEHTLFNLAVRSANLICQQASPHSLTPTVQWFSVRYATIDITAQYCTYQSFPRKIANYLSHLIFVVSTWIAFSFLWSFQYFIVSHRLIPPLLKKKNCFWEGLFWRMPRNQDFCARNRFYVPVQALNVFQGRWSAAAQVPGLCDCEAKGSDCRALPKLDAKPGEICPIHPNPHPYPTPPAHVSCMPPSSVQLYLHNRVLFMYSDVFLKMVK